MTEILNLFAVTGDEDRETLETLASGKNVRVERIVSTGQASPPDFWYDQDETEWVALLQGRAGLEIEGDELRELAPGDCLLLPAHTKHRVAWTQDQPPTIWLAFFWRES